MYMYRDTTNVEHDMHNYTSNNWSHQSSNKRFKEKFRSHIKKTFNRFTIKTAILGTSHIIQIVLQSETWSLSGGGHYWFKRSTRENRPLTWENTTTPTAVAVAAAAMAEAVTSSSSSVFSNCSTVLLKENMVFLKFLQKNFPSAIRNCNNITFTPIGWLWYRMLSCLWRQTVIRTFREATRVWWFHLFCKRLFVTQSFYIGISRVHPTTCRKSTEGGSGIPLLFL